MGVLPLAFSVGAGAEMRQAMASRCSPDDRRHAFGIFLTPVFYVLCARSPATGR